MGSTGVDNVANSHWQAKSALSWQFRKHRGFGRWPQQSDIWQWGPMILILFCKKNIWSTLQRVDILFL